MPCGGVGRVGAQEQAAASGTAGAGSASRGTGVGCASWAEGVVTGNYSAVAGQQKYPAAFLQPAAQLAARRCWAHPRQAASRPLVSCPQIPAFTICIEYPASHPVADRVYSMLSLSSHQQVDHRLPRLQRPLAQALVRHLCAAAAAAGEAAAARGSGQSGRGARMAPFCKG